MVLLANKEGSGGGKSRASTRVAGVRVASIRVARMRVAGMRGASMRFAHMRVARMRVARMFKALVSVCSSHVPVSALMTVSCILGSPLSMLSVAFRVLPWSKCLRS